MVALNHRCCSLYISAVIRIVPKLFTLEALDLRKWHIELGLRHRVLCRLLGPRRVPALLLLLFPFPAVAVALLLHMLLHCINLHRRIARVCKWRMHILLLVFLLLARLTNLEDAVGSFT